MASRVSVYPPQAEALAFIDEWIALGPDSQTWRRNKSEIASHLGATCALFLGGHPGRGKSVLAAHAVHRVFVDAGLVDTFRWHSQATLAQLFAERFARDSEQSRRRADEALTDWRLVTECPLLVIDDLWAQQLTPAFGEALAALIRERLDHVRATVMTSNHPPQWPAYFAHDVGRLQSRFDAYGKALRVGGQDMRAMRLEAR